MKTDETFKNAKNTPLQREMVLILISKGLHFLILGFRKLPAELEVAVDAV
jgi:hypothetical protein